MLAKIVNKFFALNLVLFNLDLCIVRIQIYTHMISSNAICHHTNLVLNIMYVHACTPVDTYIHTYTYVLTNFLQYVAM